MQGLVREVAIDAGDGRRIVGDLDAPHDAVGVVAFAHGSGSSRSSPRNRRVARALNEARLATLLIDLLDSAEEAVDIETARLRFDIPLLAGRLAAAVGWLRRDLATAHLPIGLFGASTGAAAALVAAAREPAAVAAVVSRGGRPDLAGHALDAVRAATLLIVGGADREVLALNRAAFHRLRCEKRLDVVARAGHLFEEAGALDVVARSACGWFAAHLAAPRSG